MSDAQPNLKVYDPDTAKSISLAAALKKMTPDWIDGGNCCGQTTIDLLEACRTLMAENRRLRMRAKING